MFLSPLCTKKKACLFLSFVVGFAVPLEVSFFRLATTSAGVSGGPTDAGSVAFVSSVGVEVSGTANVGGGDSDDGMPALDIV